MGEEILTPKALVVPSVSATTTLNNLPDGSLYMSGGKLYFMSGAGVAEMNN